MNQNSKLRIFQIGVGGIGELQRSGLKARPNLVTQMGNQRARFAGRMQSVEILLAVKATRFPGQELRWDAANFRFTNHDEANAEILSRTYREGFAPQQVN